jgi:predicted nucleic acid-binding protein
MLRRGDALYTSAFTLGEILVQPIALNRPDLADRYRAFFRDPGITVLPFDLATSAHYARIRQDRRIRPEDAIQLACAAAVEMDLFITNDDRLSRRVVDGIRFITSLDAAPV